MRKTDYKDYVRTFFVDRGISVSKTAMREFSNKRLVNYEALSQMSDREVRRNMGSILNEILDGYRSRAKESITGRQLLLRDIDVKPVLLSKFCRLPPICRRSKKRG